MRRRTKSPSRSEKPPVLEERGHNLSTGERFWGAVHCRFGDNHAAFKDAVVKDLELVAMVGGLIMTVAFAGLSMSPYAQEDLTLKADEVDIKVVLRMIYVFFVVAGCCFSSAGTLIAIRTVLLVNASPVTDTLQLLVNVSNLRTLPWLHAFNAIKAAVVSMLLAVCTFVLCSYSYYEFTICAVMMALTIGLLNQEDANHAKARTMAFASSAIEPSVSSH